jgi:hypothetical protein
VREQRVVLEDRVHVAFVRRQPRDVPPPQQDPPRCRLLEAGDHPQAGGLTGARWPEQREELAGPDVEGDAVDRDHVTEPLDHVIEDDRGLRAGRPPLRFVHADRLRHRPPSPDTPDPGRIGPS